MHGEPVGLVHQQILGAREKGLDADDLAQRGDEPRQGRTWDVRTCEEMHSEIGPPRGNCRDSVRLRLTARGAERRLR